MIGAEIKSREKRRAGASAGYAAGENEREKVLATGFGNCFAETFKDAAAEMDADDRAYNGPGDNVSHWVFSLHSDESITPDQFQEFVENFMKDQGMENHKYAWGLHKNTENLHGHLTFLRTKPEPEPDGSYKIQNFGGREKWKNGTSNRYECSRATIIDFCAKYGLKADFEEVAARPSADAIRLSQKIQAGEAQTGKPHPKRLIAEQARDVLRQSNSWNDVYNELHKYGIGLTITDGWKDGKYWQGAVITGPEGEKIPLSALPRDCSLKNLQTRFAGGGESFNAPKTNASADFYKGKMTVGKAKSAARAIFNGSSSLAEAEAKLAEKGMTLERQGKTGCYLRYGEADDQKMKLSALGGKYSLFALSKKYNGQGSNDNATMHRSQGKVNASSMQSASKYADRANDRASSAAERATAVAAEGVQAKTLAEALDDAFSQAVALDALRKANRVAAVAQGRLGEMEGRAERAEKALAESQHTEITTKNEEKKMESHFDTTRYDYNAARAALMLACPALAEKDNEFAAVQLEKADQALSRVARRSYEIAPGADTSALLDAASRLYELCDDVHEYQVVSSTDDEKIMAALDRVIEEHTKIAPGAPTTIETVIHAFPHPYDPDDTAPRRIPAWALKDPADRTPAERAHEEIVGAQIEKEEKSLRDKGWSEDRIKMHMGAVRVPEILGEAGERLYTPEMRAAEEVETKAAARAFAASFDTSNAPTTIDPAAKQQEEMRKKAAQIAAPAKKGILGALGFNKKPGIGTAGPAAGPRM